MSRCPCRWIVAFCCHSAVGKFCFKSVRPLGGVTAVHGHSSLSVEHVRQWRNVGDQFQIMKTNKVRRSPSLTWLSTSPFASPSGPSRRNAVRWTECILYNTSAQLLYINVINLSFPSRTYSSPSLSLSLSTVDTDYAFEDRRSKHFSAGEALITGKCSSVPGQSQTLCFYALIDHYNISSHGAETCSRVTTLGGPSCCMARRDVYTRGPDCCD